MHNRGGFPVRNVAYAVLGLLLLYMIYIYYGSRNALRETEMTAARYRRESEERVVEIQSLLQAKDKQHETCQNEKHELNNHIKSINQQHSMLQSQFKETEADFMKLKQDMENMKSEHMAAESQHAQEFQSLKQQKDMELSDLKDKVANLQRQNGELQQSLDLVNQQLLAAQDAQQRLLMHNTQLQQQVQTQQQQQQHQEQKQPSPNMKFQPGFQSNFNHANNGNVNNMKISDGRPFDVGSELHNNNKAFGHFGHRKDLDPETAEANLDHLNAQHQMVPPQNKEVIPEDRREKEEENEKDLGDNVKPNDPEKHQILEPMINEVVEKNLGGGEADGASKVDLEKLEEDRAGGIRDEEEAALGQGERVNPLQLDQMDIPNREVNKGHKLGQQLLPMAKNTGEKLEGDPQYFEDEDQNQDNKEEEEEEEEGNPRQDQNDHDAYHDLGAGEEH